MRVVNFKGGPLATNGYLVADEGARQAIMLDPPHGAAGGVARCIESEGWSLVMIVNTHGHWDHIGGDADLKRMTGAGVAAHPLEIDSILHPDSVGMAWGVTTRGIGVDSTIDAGYTLEAGKIRLHVLHTPGHSPGSICLHERSEGVLFSGDTLFDGACGRTDLKGGDDARMLTSLAMLADLPAETKVYPGHGEATRMGDQRWLAEVRGGR